MREDELYFSYGMPENSDNILETERRLWMRCEVGECTSMIDIRAQQFFCSFHGGGVVAEQHSVAVRSFDRSLGASAPKPTQRKGRVKLISRRTDVRDGG